MPPPTTAPPAAVDAGEDLTLGDAETIGSSKATRADLALRAGRCVGIVLVPFLAFCWRIGLWTLDPLAAPRMLMWDYSTYISAPNFLRTAPLLSMPIGSTPDLMAPVGASLGLTDSSPILLPVYRLLNAISPNRPTQLVGPILLIAYCGTFYALYKILRLIHARWHPIDDHGAYLVGLLGATGLLLNPMFLLRFVHPTLTHHWIVLWPIYTVLRDWRDPPPIRRQFALVMVQALAAAAIQPYFLPMVVIFHIPWMCRMVARRPGTAAVRVSAYLAVIASVSYALGYVGSGAQRQNAGYGLYSTNLAFFIDPSHQSRLLHDLRTLPDHWEGRGYLGAGILMLGLAACTALFAGDRARAYTLLKWFRLPFTCGAVLAIIAALPVLYLGKWQIVDLRAPLEPIAGMLETFRTNGRLVWALAWTTGLLIVGCAAALRSRTVAVGLLALCVVVQVQDLTPAPLASRPSADYELARDVLLADKTQGALAVEVIPPSIMHACTSGEIPLEQVYPVILAAGVLRLSVNSGYPGRPVPEFTSEICDAQTTSFSRGERRSDVVYVLNASRPETAAMDCTRIAPELVACMS